jgi:hypothetical protein
MMSQNQEKRTSPNRNRATGASSITMTGLLTGLFACVAVFVAIRQSFHYTKKITTAIIVIYIIY